MAASRRRAREHALQMLCILDTQGDLLPEEGAALFYENLVEPGEVNDEARRYAEQLVRGVRGSLDELDRLISESSRNWRLERMNWVDRNLLRLAAYELRSAPDVPARVSINEAIEIAKRFGASESSAFVNGLLDRLMEEIGRG